MDDRTETYAWGDMIWHSASPAPFTAASMFMHSGTRAGRHLHDNANEMLIVGAGSVTLVIDGTGPVHLKEGESHLIPAGTAHEVINHPNAPARLTLIFDSPARNYTALNDQT